MRFLINSKKHGSAQSAALIIQLAYRHFQNRLAATNNPLMTSASAEQHTSRPTVINKALSVGSILMETQSFTKKHEASAGARRPKRDPSKPKATSVLFRTDSPTDQFDQLGRPSRLSFEAEQPPGGRVREPEKATLGALQRVEALLLQLLAQNAPVAGSAPQSGSWETVPPPVVARSSVLQLAQGLQSAAPAAPAASTASAEIDATASQVVTSAVATGEKLAVAPDPGSGASDSDDQFAA